MSLLLEHQRIDYQPGAQDRCPVEDPEAPWARLLAVLVYFIKCPAEQKKRQNQEDPAIALRPQCDGKSSQAKTGQDEGQLSAERINQRRGDRPALHNIAVHRFSPLRLSIA